jgi:hypothetical protein
MLVFNSPYSFRKQLGQDVVAAPAPVVVAPAPVVVSPVVPVAPAVPVAPNYDKSLVTLTPAGMLVGGVVLLGIAFSLAGAFAKR